jgi:hypothetical protein
MKQLTNTTETTPYNLKVEQAYFKVLKYAKTLISSLEDDNLRTVLFRDFKTRGTGGVIHEFVNPLIFLRLGCIAGQYVIHFGFQETDEQPECSEVTTTFMRGLYRLTSKQVTGINIENCIKCDWLISNPTEMYDYLLEQNEHHTFALLSRKVKASERKRLLSVA